MARVHLGLFLGLCLGAIHCDRADSKPRACTDEDALALFDERIAPLMSGEHQSSCNECHLSGIDLGLYVQGDPCATMACMVDLGIVDLDSPDDSLVLQWIERAAPKSELITADVIEAEHDAMREWIAYNGRCGASVCPPAGDNPCGDRARGTCEVPGSAPSSGSRTFDDPGDCSDVTLEAGFGALVYSWRGRCYPCHFDSWDADFDSPRWISDDACNLGSLQTMRNAIDAGLLDVEDPRRSLLLLKPLAEAAGGVEHGGHDKFADTDDPAYVDFRRWIERWAACQGA